LLVRPTNERIEPRAAYGAISRKRAPGDPDRGNKLAKRQASNCEELVAAALTKPCCRGKRGRGDANDGVPCLYVHHPCPHTWVFLACRAASAAVARRGGGGAWARPRVSPGAGPSIGGSGW